MSGAKKRSGVTAAKGFVGAGGYCGIKPDGVSDLALILSATPAVAAGVFTTNRIVGAPVTVSKKHLRSGLHRGIVISSGNANVFTPNGITDATTMTETAAAATGARKNQWLVASTGVIGEPLPIDKIVAGIETVSHRLSPTGGGDVARAIMTTDLIQKEAQTTLTIGAKKVIVGGCVKGSGMIHPTMATLLAFITTDAAITKTVAKELVKRANQKSFNRITIDGDTSTSDMFILMANGASGAPLIDTTGGKRFSALLTAVTTIATTLAKKVVSDGEGASKFVTIMITGARSDTDAHTMAKTIAHSPLVKTALFGQDANFGRILCAAGYSGTPFDPAKISLTISGAPIIDRGALRTGWEKKAGPKFKKKEITLALDLGCGKGKAEVWTCDLSYDYIRINTAYRS